VPVTTGNGGTADLAIGGNVTVSQMSGVTLLTDYSTASTTISFTVTGESGTTGFSNITVPASAVSFGTTPTVYIDGQVASNQGYTQDSSNYYVWYTIQFTTHQVSIVFATHAHSPSPTPAPVIPQGYIYGIVVVVVIVVTVAAVLMLRKSKKGKT